MESPIKLIAHCDWSKNARKRWLTLARKTSRKWIVEKPELVGRTDDLIERMKSRSPDGGCSLIGFDFPIGLPISYGKMTGFRSFRHALSQLGKDDWRDWFSVCRKASEISIHRPFYPYKPGGTSQKHLFEGLGVEDRLALMRECERATDDTRAACMLFWTLGGNQVGKAAIEGWQEIIVPNTSKVGLWPFDGTLSQLSAEYNVVLAETYPANAYRQIGIPIGLPTNKKSQPARKDVAHFIDAWFEARSDVDLGDGVVDLFQSGFSEKSWGEDQFDSFTGLLGMIDVVSARRPEGAASNLEIANWEGWIFGRSS